MDLFHDQLREHNREPLLIAICIKCECTRIFKQRDGMNLQASSLNQDWARIICRTACYSCISTTMETQNEIIKNVAKAESTLKDYSLLNKDPCFGSSRAFVHVMKSGYAPDKDTYYMTYPYISTCAFETPIHDLIICKEHTLNCF
jgi:hypothetical protein